MKANPINLVRYLFANC